MSSYRNQAKSDLDREDLDLKDDIPLIKARHEKFFLRTLAVLPQVSLKDIILHMSIYNFSFSDISGPMRVLGDCTEGWGLI